MTLTEPQLFEEALRKLDDRQIALSPLRSREWREKVPTALRDRAFFSATLENARVAQAMKDFIANFLSKAIDPATGGLKAQGRAEFVADLRALCIREGLGKLDPATGRIDPEIDESDLTDLRSMARLQLIFDTQTTAAHEYGYWAQGNDPDLLYAYPAQRFIRIRPVRAPRPYHAANENAVRRKDDLDFWLSMNPDFGVPWGPWGFNSGMGVEDVDRIEAENLGLLAPGEEISSPEHALNDHLSAGIRDLDPDLRAELLQIFGPQIRQNGGRLEWTGNISDYTPAPAKPPKPRPRTIQSITRRVAKAATRQTAHNILALQASHRGTLPIVALPSDLPTKQTAEAAVQFLESMVHQDYLLNIAALTIAEDTSPDARAYYELDTRTAFIRRDTGVAAHEFMHHIECQNPALYRKAKAFRKRRTKGETTEKLSILTGNAGYQDDEVAYKDKWAQLGGSHYTGKDYGPTQATEILTMGIERLYNDPIEFAKNDPEYFRFIIRTIQKL